MYASLRSFLNLSSVFLSLESAWKDHLESNQDFELDDHLQVCALSTGFLFQLVVFATVILLVESHFIFRWLPFDDQSAGYSKTLRIEKLNFEPRRTMECAHLE